MKTPNTDAKAKQILAELGPNNNQRFAAMADYARELERALQLHLEFLASLPSGWLGHTSGDVGKLNEAFLASRKLGMKIK